MTKISDEDKTTDVVVEHAPAPDKPSVDVVIASETKAKASSDPLSEMREAMKATEDKYKEETVRREAAERDRDSARATARTTRTELEGEQINKVKAQETAISNRVAAAKSNVENAKRSYEDAVDRGMPAKDQVDFQSKLAEAVYELKGAEGAQGQFATWKENSAKKASAAPADNGVTPKAQAWIDSNPEFNTNRRFKSVAIAAHEEAIQDRGIPPDSDAYFDYINGALREANLLKDKSVASDVREPSRRTATSEGAPVTHGEGSGSASGDTRSTKTFRLDPQMREMAHRTFGPGTSHNLSTKEAEVKYAKRRMEIQQKRQNGDQI